MWAEKADGVGKRYTRCGMVAWCRDDEVHFVWANTVRGLRAIIACQSPSHFPCRPTLSC